jgi:predicted nucleotidyltransferase
MNVLRSPLEEACQRHRVWLLVLFGSHVPGGLPPRPDSDVDVAVAFRRGTTRPPYLELSGDLAAAFPDASLDLVFLGDADPLFRWEIMARGVLLFGDIDAFLELRAFAYRDFVDSADLRTLEQVLSEKKLNAIGEWLRAAR